MSSLLSFSSHPMTAYFGEKNYHWNKLLVLIDILGTQHISKKMFIQRYRLTAIAFHNGSEYYADECFDMYLLFLERHVSFLSDISSIYGNPVVTANSDRSDNLRMEHVSTMLILIIGLA